MIIILWSLLFTSNYFSWLFYCKQLWKPTIWILTTNVYLHFKYTSLLSGWNEATILEGTRGNACNGVFNKRKEIPHINETGCLKRAKRLKFIYTNSFPKASKRKLELEIQILIFDNKILYLESEMKIPRDIANVLSQP